MKRPLKQKGETIVEVLIAIAILALVLSASYALARRSSQGVRQAQERSEALKFAEEQLELLKSYGSTSRASIPNNSVFCVRLNGSSVEVINNVDVNSGDNCNKGPDGRYKITVQKSGSNFASRVVWDNVTGSTDNLEINYRLY